MQVFLVGLTSVSSTSKIRFLLGKVTSEFLTSFLPPSATVLIKSLTEWLSLADGGDAGPRRPAEEGAEHESH